MPQIGRFAGEDAAKYGSNWYAYCSSNPLNFVDPLGLCEVADASNGQEMAGISNVELLNYAQVRDLVRAIPAGSRYLSVTDVRTGTVFNLRVIHIYDKDSGHLDVVPATSCDREAISTFRTRYTWGARPKLVTVGDHIIPASLHNFPHSSNNGGLDPNGHLCLHFLGTIVLNDSQQENSQAAVEEAKKARANLVARKVNLIANLS